MVNTIVLLAPVLPVHILQALATVSKFSTGSQLCLGGPKMSLSWSTPLIH